VTRWSDLAPRATRGPRGALAKSARQDRGFVPPES
jgi:hypothetical protein